MNKWLILIGICFLMILTGCEQPTTPVSIGDSIMPKNSDDKLRISYYEGNWSVSYSSDTGLEIDQYGKDLYKMLKNLDNFIEDVERRDNE